MDAAQQVYTDASSESSSVSTALDIAVTSSAHDDASFLSIPVASSLLTTQKTGGDSDSSVSFGDSYLLPVVIASAIGVLVIISVVAIIRRRKRSALRAAASNPWLTTPSGSIASETPVMSASSSPVEFIVRHGDQELLGRGTSILRFSECSQSDEPESVRQFKAQHWAFLYDNRSASASDRPPGDYRSPTANYNTQTLTPPAEDAANAPEEEPSFEREVASCWV